VTGLVKAEFRKLLTTQVWFWMLVVAMSLTVLGVVGTIVGAESDAILTAQVRDVFVASSAAFTYVPLFVLGVLAITTEFRYQTITPTVLTTPSRWTLINAKIIAYVIVGIAYALACLIVELAVAVPWLAARGIDYSLSDQLGALLAVFVVLTLFTLFGLGAGALLKNQVVAVTVGVIFIVVLANLVLVIPGLKYAYAYLPTGLVSAIVTRSDAERTFNDVTLLAPGTAAVVLVIWGIGMALLGAAITMRRDIT
jgi:ABC-type transport system involved in multi-copper enzyme maturation permease subunit